MGQKKFKKNKPKNQVVRPQKKPKTNSKNKNKLTRHYGAYSSKETQKKPKTNSTKSCTQLVLKKKPKKSKNKNKIMNQVVRPQKKTQKKSKNKKKSKNQVVRPKKKNTKKI